MAKVTLKDSGILFKEDTHQYFRQSDGKELKGITDLLHRQLFPTEWDSIPEYMRDKILNASADYGHSVHKSCEDFDKEWINDGTVELQDYIEICKQYGLVHEASEFTVTDGENYASNIDKIYRTGEKTVCIADIKTLYGKIKGDKLEKCRWQCSIYAYLLEKQCNKIKVDKLYIIHLRNKQRKNGTFDHVAELIPIERIPSDICNELLQADLEGRQFVNPYAIPEDFNPKLIRIKELMEEKTKIEEELYSLKSDVMSSMEILNVTSWATDTMMLTRKLPSTRSSFDFNSFKAAHTEINDYDKYMKTSNIAGSLMIKVA